MRRDGHGNAHQITVQEGIVETREVKVRSLPGPLEVHAGIVVVDDRGVRGANRLR